MSKPKPPNEAAYKRYHAGPLAQCRQKRTRNAYSTRLTPFQESRRFARSLICEGSRRRTFPRSILSAYIVNHGEMPEVCKPIISSNFKIFLDNGGVDAIACSSFKCLDRRDHFYGEKQIETLTWGEDCILRRMTVVASRKPLANSQAARSCPVCRDNSHDGQMGARTSGIQLRGVGPC